MCYCIFKKKLYPEKNIGLITDKKSFFLDFNEGNQCSLSLLNCVPLGQNCSSGGDIGLSYGENLIYVFGDVTSREGRGKYVFLGIYISFAVFGIEFMFSFPNYIRSSCKHTNTFISLFMPQN